jgi:hypothetical protein
LESCGESGCTCLSEVAGGLGWTTLARTLPRSSEHLIRDRVKFRVGSIVCGALEQLWGEAAVNTWNARRASVLSWLGWCGEHGYDGPKVPAWAKRMTPPDSETRLARRWRSTG